MLKSTHAPVAPVISSGTTPLPPGWTEHKAPTGHTYYYNAETKKSTYTRPAPQFQLPPPQPFIPSYGAGQFAGGFSNNQFPNNTALQAQQDFGRSARGGGGTFSGPYEHGRGHQYRRRYEPEDKPKHRYMLPGCDPWILVKTKLGRRFVHNLETKESFWKFPEHVLKGVIEYDRRERERKERRERGEASEEEDEAVIAMEEVAAAQRAETEGPANIPSRSAEIGDDSSEYEEVEVTDDEDEEATNGEGSAKRQKTEDVEDQPLEFDEDDIAYQLQAMGEEYGLDPGEYGMEGDDWEDGAQGLPLTEDDSKALFRELLDDLGVNPFNPWEKIVEQGFIIDDDRYIALPNMRARKECFDEWSRDKIQQLRDEREKEDKKDPRIPYFRLLEEHASTKLYWPEFKRKYKKEAAMRDTDVSDKEKEKLYREHVKRLQLAQSTLKADLMILLQAQPLSLLNRSTSVSSLPSTVLTDLRFISLPIKIRDPIVETYISTLPLAPSDALSIEDEEVESAKKRDRERREKALAEREQRVRDEKRRAEKDLAYGKGRLREEERELQRAMNFGKGGLKGQLEVLNDALQEKATAEEGGQSD